MSQKSNPAPAGANYKVEKSTRYIGEQAVGSKRNEGLSTKSLPDYMVTHREDDEYSPVPEYSEPQQGGRSRNHLEVPAKKRNAVQSRPQGVSRKDSNPNNEQENSTSGPRHPGKGVTGSTPRHNAAKPRSSNPDNGPHPTNKKDSVNPVTYGNRGAESQTIRKRSDLVPQDSPMISPDGNPKLRDAAVGGISRESLKSASKLGGKSKK